MIALAIGRVLGRAVPVPALALLAAGPAVLFAAVAIAGDEASPALAAAVLAWLILTVGATSARRPRASFMWAVAPLVRLGEYVDAALAGRHRGSRGVPAAFALLAVLAYRHYDLVYRMRHRGDATPAWLNRLALGWDGRLVHRLGAARARGAAGGDVRLGRRARRSLSVAETVMAWRRFEASRRPSEYESEEDEAE